jgi:hypothetical protein
MSKVYKQVNFVAGVSGAAFGGGSGGGSRRSRSRPLNSDGIRMTPTESARAASAALEAEKKANSTPIITQNELKTCLTAGATAAILAGAPALTVVGAATLPAAVGTGATVTGLCLVGAAFTN